MTDKNDLAFFVASMRNDIATLDLHGTFPFEVREKLEIFLAQAIEKDERVVKIIYGGGTGRLREIVLNFLRPNKMVKKTEELGGSCLILLADGCE